MGKGCQQQVEFACTWNHKSRKLLQMATRKKTSFCLTDKPLIAAALYMHGSRLSRWLVRIYFYRSLENFDIKKFRMHSGVRKLNTQNMFNSEIFTGRKRLYKHVLACATPGQYPESVATCSYILEVHYVDPDLL